MHFPRIRTFGRNFQSFSDPVFGAEIVKNFDEVGKNIPVSSLLLQQKCIVFDTFSCVMIESLKFEE